MKFEGLTFSEDTTIEQKTLVDRALRSYLPWTNVPGHYKVIPAVEEERDPDTGEITVEAQPEGREDLPDGRTTEELCMEVGEQVVKSHATAYEQTTFKGTDLG